MELINRIQIFKFKQILPIITLLSYLFVKDIAFKLNSISKGLHLQSKASFVDILLSTLYGLNNNIKITMLDRTRWGLIFILLFYFIGIYLNDTLTNSNRYIWLIRLKSSRLWVLDNILNILFFVFIYISYFFANITIFAYLEGSKVLTTTKIFSVLNPYMNIKSINLNYILILFLLIFTSVFFLALMQLTICIKTNDSNKGTIFSLTIIIISSFTAEMNLINPFMLSKFNIIDNRLSYNVYLYIILNIILILLLVFLNLKFSRKIGKE